MPVTSAATFVRLRERLDWRQGGLVAFLLALLVAFILYPILRVLWISLSDDQGNLTLVHFLHFFPFILLNSVVSLSNIDPSLEEVAQNLGCHGFRLWRLVTLPLMLPGFIAGSLLTFIRAIDDLGTPLMLNYKNLLAPQAYLRITTIGMDDVDGYVVCVVLVVLSLVSLLAARKYLGLAEYATAQRSAPVTRHLQGKKVFLVWLLCGAILGVSLLPHIGILLLSFSKV